MFDFDRLIFFNGLIDGENLVRLTGLVERSLCRLAAENPQAPVTLCITSPGGHLSSSHGFFERIILSGYQNIHTIALDDTSSAALFLYIIGKKRFVARHTTFFLHQIGTCMDDYGREVAATCNTQVTPQDIYAFMTKDGTELTAHDALFLGLAHEILSLEEEKQLRAWRDKYISETT